MGVCFLHCWPAPPRFKSFVLQPVGELCTATSFVFLAQADDREAIQMHAKQPVKERLLHYQLSNLS